MSKQIVFIPLITGTPSLSVTTIAWRPSTLHERRRQITTEAQFMNCWLCFPNSKLAHSISPTQVTCASDFVVMAARTALAGRHGRKLPCLTRKQQFLVFFWFWKEVNTPFCRNCAQSSVCIAAEIWWCVFWCVTPVKDGPPRHQCSSIEGLSAVSMRRSQFGVVRRLRWVSYALTDHLAMGLERISSISIDLNGNNCFRLLPLWIADSLWTNWVCGLSFHCLHIIINCDCILKTSHCYFHIPLQLFVQVSF